MEALALLKEILILVNVHLVLMEDTVNQVFFSSLIFYFLIFFFENKIKQNKNDSPQSLRSKPMSKRCIMRCKWNFLHLSMSTWYLWKWLHRLLISLFFLSLSNIYFNLIIAPNPCDPNPCQNGASCIANGIFYTCQCPPGTYGSDCTSY